MERIRLDLDRQIGRIDRGIFGGFVEHLGRCVYGGILDPTSPHAAADGVREDVVTVLKRLGLSNIRYPGGNFVSGYRWRDGVGPLEDRPPRLDLAWNAVDTNRFGTNEFIGLCRRLNAAPYLVVNCGDGDMREARDWVEYCNGTRDTELVRLRQGHGFPEPQQVRFWGIGNEVDGPWQIGFKSPLEYARTYLEFAKVMRWVDPDIALVASATSDWSADDIVERAQLLVETAPQHIDYMSIHWYVGDREHDYLGYMATSEVIEARLSAYEGLMRGLTIGKRSRSAIPLAVDEWNVWYRTTPDAHDPSFNGLEETYDLQDALVIAMHLNAFIRHAPSVRMANLAQLVNAIAPVRTTSDDLLLQTIFYPFELYSRTCGDIALDAWWDGSTFDGGGHVGVRTLDVAASLSEANGSVSVFVVNRDATEPLEVELRLDGARFTGDVRVDTVNGPDVKAANTFKDPARVTAAVGTVATARGATFAHTLEAHSITAFTFGALGQASKGG